MSTATKRTAPTAAADLNAAKKAKASTPSTPTTAGAKKDVEASSVSISTNPTTTPSAVAQSTVQIVMDDDSQAVSQSQSAVSISPTTQAVAAVAAAAAAAAVQSMSITKQVHSKEVQRVNWRYLAQGDNFQRLVKVSDLNGKDACYINFDKRQYEKETGERFSNKATHDALTIEGPWMKCVTGLHDSEQYPGSYSMMLSGEDCAADDDVVDFVEFMERCVDGFFKEVIVQKAHTWMKSKYPKHDIVTKHKETTNPIYQKCWQDGSYTEEQYKSDVMDCIKTTMRPITKDGSGPLMLFLKVYPVKDPANPKVVRPDIFIYNSENPPCVVPYAGCKIAEKCQTYVKPLFTLNRISFKDKFFVTPVTSVVRFKTIDEMENEHVGSNGQREMSFAFEGQTVPMMIPIERRKKENGPDAE